MSLNCFNCIGCGAPVGGAYKLCPRCCRLLGVKNPSEGCPVESGSDPLKKSRSAILPPSADRDFLLFFSVLSLCSVVVLGWLGLTVLAPVGAKLGLLLMECLC